MPILLDAASRIAVLALSLALTRKKQPRSTLPLFQPILRPMEIVEAVLAMIAACHRDGGFEDELLHALESEHDLEEIRILRILGAAPGG